MTEFTSWQAIGTFSGTVAIVNLIVQFSKDYLERAFPHVPTRTWVYLVSLALILLSDWVEGTIDIASIIMAIINAFVVTIASMGSYDLFIDPVRSKPTRKLKK